MTLLISWIAVDTHGPASAYIVTDSRICWEQSCNFDYAKKVFTTKRYPEIIGYAGDVLFPSIILSQIVEMIDAGLLFDKTMNCKLKNEILYNKLCSSFDFYPNVIGNNSIEILHISRETSVKHPSFHVYLLSWDKKNLWRRKEITLPIKSDIVLTLGSGKNEFLDNYKLFQKENNCFTSRNVFHCFIYTLKNINDKHCGGAPQLVGIYRKPDSPARNYGIIYNGERYFLGTEVPNIKNYNSIEWRNEYFELCNGNTKKRLNDATTQISYIALD